MRAILLSLLFVTLLSAQPASIQGMVINSVGGQPVSGAHVSLVPTDVMKAQETFGALSDRSGHFSIAGITPGPYLLIVERTGFLQVPKPGAAAIPAIRLKAGQQLQGYTIKMALHSTIAGRVLDESGDPVSGITVMVSYAPGEPLPPMLRGNSGSVTDDRGEFRVVRPPGNYYLEAVPPERSEEVAEIRTDGSADIIYGETYYPGSASADGATAVDAVAGRETGGIEIRLIRRQSLNLSGTVTGPSGPASATVWLRSKRTARSMGTAANGRFSFARLEPGPYQLYAQSTGKPSFQSQWLNLRLEDGDQTNEQLLLTAGGDLSGKVEMGGAPLTGKYAVRLEAVGPVAGAASWISGGRLDGQGGFDLSGIPPGHYRVTVNPMPDEVYVKTVMLDGVAAGGTAVDMSRGVRSGKLAITLARGAGQLSGTVRDDSGEPNVGDPGLVLLVADADPAEPQTADVTPEGKYSFQRLRPGKYHISALDLTSFSGMAQSDAAKQVASHGEALEIAEGGRVEKDLKLRTREGGDAN